MTFKKPTLLDVLQGAFTGIVLVVALKYYPMTRTNTVLFAMLIGGLSGIFILAIKNLVRKFIK